MHSINFRFISRILGMMCFVEGLMMLLVVLTALIYSEELLPWAVTIGAFFTLGSVLLHFGRRVCWP